MRAAAPAPGTRFKILIIASLRYPIAEPFAGGLEAHTYALAQGLRERGHSVLVAGAVGSDPDMVGYEFGRLPIGDPSERPDVTNHPVVQAAELQAFTSLMGQLHDGLLGAFDVIHNNALHPFPVERAATLPCPLVTTLHTPQLPWAERVLGPGSALQRGVRRGQPGDRPAVAATDPSAGGPQRSGHPSLATRPRRRRRRLVRTDRTGKGAAPGDRDRRRPPDSS